MKISEIRKYILENSFDLERELMLEFLPRKWRDKLRDKWEKHKGKLKVLGAVLGIASLAALYIGIHTGYIFKTVDKMSDGDKNARARANNSVRKFAKGKEDIYGKPKKENYYKRVFAKLASLDKQERKQRWEKEWKYFRKKQPELGGTRVRPKMTLNLQDYINYRERMVEVFKDKYKEEMKRTSENIKRMWEKFDREFSKKFKEEYDSFVRNYRERQEFARKKAAEDKMKSDEEKDREEKERNAAFERELRAKLEKYAEFKKLRKLMEIWVIEQFQTIRMDPIELQQYKNMIKRIVKILGLESRVRSDFPGIWESITRKLRAVYGRC